jgi:4-hydroxyproline epimerase
MAGHVAVVGGGVIGLCTALYKWLDRAAGKVIPSIRGSAYVTAESTLFLDQRDPFCWGIP